MALDYSYSIQKRSKTIQSSEKLKSTLHTLGAHACAEEECRNRAQVHDARLLAQKSAHLLNDTFMEVVGLPTTYGSAPKLI